MKSVPSTAEVVVDASVALAFVLEERDGADAARIRALLSNPPGRPVVAMHFDVECANGLVQAVRRGRIAVDDAFEALLVLMDLPFERAQPSASEVDAFRISIETESSAYDAAYVALSDDLGVPLVTMDARLVRTLAGTAHVVRLLDDVEL